jgi:16S rRNA (cytosine967-C5)-methyltransferase
VQHRRRRECASGGREGAEPSEELLGKADVVLVDAPCSGLGGMRREVDLRWRIKESELDLYPARQLEILEAASRFVRPGGRLVYATCSPFKSEGEEVARRFLESHPGFALDEAAPIPEAARSGPGQLRVWPDLHGGGGFFAAAMCRAAAS